MPFTFHTWFLCPWSLGTHQLSARGGNKWLCHCIEEILCSKKKKELHNLIVTALWPGLAKQKLCTRPLWSTARRTCCAEPPLLWHCTLQMPLRHERAGHHRENRTWPHLQGCTTDASNFRHVRTLIGKTRHLRNHLQLGVSSYYRHTL